MKEHMKRVNTKKLSVIIRFSYHSEGVESTIQLDFLKENNCDDIQGCLFAKPMPSVEFENILKI